MKKIYVCDDEKMLLNMVERILSPLYEVKLCMNIDELFKLVSDDKPDLILLDFLMPVANGLDGIKRLKEENYFEDVPVIMITGEGKSEIEIQCLNEGVEDFIHKPFVPDVLLKRVARVLERKESQKDLKLKMEEVINRSLHDSMTGLYNRDYAVENIDKSIEKYGRGVYVMVDLDNFKYLNDAYGHLKGDDAICAVADILADSVRDRGFAFRLGGDEFGIFLTNLSDRKTAEKYIIDLFGEYNRQAVERDYLINSSLSIGIATAPEDGKNYDELYAAADKALYCAKRNGKNGYCFYSVDFTDTSESRAEVVNIKQLKKLIEDRQEIREKKGVYKVDYREFQRIYNFIERCVERTHQRAKLVMVTLDCGQDEPSIVVEKRMKEVEQAIVSSLRRNDVGTRYSISQFLLVLIDVDTQNLENVVETRIKKHYEDVSGRDSAELLFEIMDIKQE